jgi:hypothetical protein
MNTKFKMHWVLMAALALSGCRADDTFYSNLLKTDVFVQQYSDSRFDFLWVMDNSGSMAPHRQFVKDNIQTFLNILNSRKAVDFQMAVTTTDMFSDGGRLIQSGSGVRVVKSATSSNPSAEFGAIIDAVVDSPTSFWEQGLESAYQAIANSKAQFSRTGVPLILIFVTDENDYSCQNNCFGVEPENNPGVVLFDVSRYSAYFKATKEAEKSQTMIFPIIGMNTSSCVVASNGVRYESVQTTLGGSSLSGSICSSELRSSYESIARVIADRGMVFKLSTPSSSSGIRLYVDGKLIPYSPENYVLDATTNSIVFTGVVPKSGSVIEVSYSQKL